MMQNNQQYEPLPTPTLPNMIRRMCTCIIFSTLTLSYSQLAESAETICSMSEERTLSYPTGNPVLCERTNSRDKLLEICILHHKHPFMAHTIKAPVQHLFARRLCLTAAITYYNYLPWFSVMSVGRIETVTQLFCLRSTFFVKSCTSFEVMLFTISS